MPNRRYPYVVNFSPGDRAEQRFENVEIMHVQCIEPDLKKCRVNDQFTFGPRSRVCESTRV
jgi:hypothetical protein